MTGGSWQLRRSHRRKKQREEQERLWEERRNQPRAAFRSLSPFEEQDELPGQDRKQLARSIAVRIVNDDFRFGIVCGDSGAGKTSLLRSEVMRNIRANGLEPVYLRSPRRLARTGLAVVSSRERLATELEAFEQEQIPADKCVLILDQFEEWFVEHREPEARALLGRFIARLIQRVPPVRVVCAVRREFLMDFHDLAAELPDPTNPANTFRVRNFTVAQAIDAVQQCALADGIAAEEAFAAALADDLADNGEVRPPELQIVCTHLAESGSLSLSRYQAEGGTAGILAHHIRNALESCREPDLGAKLLRSLCDFPTRTKRPPKTLAELAADIGRTAGSQAVAALVRTFVLARLLAEEKRKSGPDAYALLHDYLVGAVELATGDVSTQTEEANQLLRYHLAQQRGVIPLRRLRFIRAHADRPLLVQPNARRLLHKSLIVPAVFSGAMVFVAVLMAGGLYLVATAGIQWQEKVIGRHWEEDEVGRVEYKILSEKGQIISLGEKHIRFWDIKNGTIFTSKKILKGLSVDINSSGNLLLFKDFLYKKNINCKLIDLNNREEFDLPASSRCKFSESEQYVIYESSLKDKDNYLFSVNIWSVSKKSIIYKINKISKPDISNIRIETNGERLVTLSWEGNRDVIMLYDASSGKKIKNMTDNNKKGLYFYINSLSKKVCTISIASSGENVLQVWNIDDGHLACERKNMFFVTDISFSIDGKYIVCRDDAYIVGGREIKNQNKINILTIADLESAHGVKIGDMRLSNEKDSSAPIVYWRDGNDVKLWHVSKGEPILLKNIKLGEEDEISSSADMQIAVISGPQRPAELWDLKEKKLLRLLISSKDKHIQSVAFSMNDTAVVITEEGGVASLFDAKDGSPLAQHISAASVYYYDPDLRRIHLWNSSGQVIRHVEGRSYFGWFRPTKKGARD
ncbi:MAG: nSTAND1 domain-containing NTPase [Candidatus Electronema sp. V4]|uniref:nSTAND1 domain-containing NTPase n=1 Tax=Candidatus Electronema sp. V4 TaxID=3454756 RepID=UPI00405543A7